MKILTFGDLHFHHYHQFSHPVEFGYTVRLQEQINTCKEIAKVIRKEKPDVVCCGGDVFHTWSTVDTIVLDAIVEGIHEIDLACQEIGKKFNIIVGNHDQLSDNNMSSNSLRPFKYYPNIVLHEQMEEDAENNIVYIPYVMENSRVSSFVSKVENKEKKVVIAHLDFLGAKYSDTIVDQSGNDTNVFSKFKKVIGHHYHLPQKLGKNFVFPGSPQVFSFNEPRSALTRGVIVYDTETDKVKRIALDVPDWVKIDDMMPIGEIVKELKPNNYVKLSLASDYSLCEEDVTLEDIKNKFLGVEVEFDVERIKISSRKRDSEDIILESEEDVLKEFIDSQDCSEEKKKKYRQVGLTILGKVRH